MAVAPEGERLRHVGAVEDIHRGKLGLCSSSIERLAKYWSIKRIPIMIQASLIQINFKNGSYFLRPAMS